MKSNLIRLRLLPVALFACVAALQAAEVTVIAPDSPMLRFALGKLEAALQRQADTLKRTTNQAPGQAAEIAVTVDPALMTEAQNLLRAQGYEIYEFRKRSLVRCEDIRVSRGRNFLMVRPQGPYRARILNQVREPVRPIRAGSGGRSPTSCSAGWCARRRG